MRAVVVADIASSGFEDDDRCKLRDKPNDRLTPVMAVINPNLSARGSRLLGRSSLCRT